MKVWLCTACLGWHRLWWSPWCVMCWGYTCGFVPGDRADDGEVMDDCGGDHAAA